MGDRWIILRCTGARTLELAASLSEAGYEAWTPAETVTRRSRSGDKLEPVAAPLTPSFVFAKAGHLLDLLALSRSPSLNYQVWDREQRKMVTHGHPYFGLFRYAGEVASIPDGQLSALRKLERKRTPKPEVAALEVGTRIRLAEAGFEGLWGTVESSRKSYTRLSIDGWMIPVDFPTWTLRAQLDEAIRNGVDDAQALNAKAA